jgi:NAD+ synthase
MRDPEALVTFLVGWLRERVDATGAGTAVFGLSGGIDSAVVCGLAAQAVGGDRCLGVVMPIGNSPEDTRLGHDTARAFGARVAELDLAPAFGALESSLREVREGFGLEPRDDETAVLASANLKPRLRMAALYHLANLADGIVLGTGNRAERTIGYFTKHGDGGADLLPIADLLKGEVRAVAEVLGVPREIIDRPPSAGLWEGQTDEGEMGFGYDALDRYLAEGSSGSQSLDETIAAMERRSAHKREPTPIARPA